MLEVVGPYALPYEDPGDVDNEPPVGFDWAGAGSAELFQYP